MSIDLRELIIKELVRNGFNEMEVLSNSRRTISYLSRPFQTEVVEYSVENRAGKEKLEIRVHTIYHGGQIPKEKRDASILSQTVEFNVGEGHRSVLVYNTANPGFSIYNWTGNFGRSIKADVADELPKLLSESLRHQ